MKIIRRSVFETNSSSTHAIAITKSDKNLQSPGYISLDYDGEYSWDYKVINDLDGKFTYLAVIASNYIDNLFKDPEREEFYKSHEGINISEFELRFFMDKLKKLGFSFGDREDKIVNRLCHENDYDYFIDHGDDAVGLYLSLLKDDDKLKRFLLSSDSFITTGNDNDEKDIWEDPNSQFGLGMTPQETEWGSTVYNENQLKDRFDIYYKGN